MVLIMLVVLTVACDSNNAGASITDIKLSKQLSERGEPLNPSSAFLTTDKKIHCVVYFATAPAGTLVRAKWIAVRAEDRRENEDVGQSTAEVKDQNNAVGLTFSPAETRMTPGAYRVDIYLNPDGSKNSVPAKSMDFTVAAGAPEITRAMLATEAGGKGAVTNIRAGVRRLFCFAMLRGATAGTRVVAKWIAEDVKGRGKGTILQQRSVNVGEGQNAVDLIYEDGAGLASGVYRVDLFIGESARPARSISFTVDE